MGNDLQALPRSIKARARALYRRHGCADQELLQRLHQAPRLRRGCGEDPGRLSLRQARRGDRGGTRRRWWTRSPWSAAPTASTDRLQAWKQAGKEHAVGSMLLSGVTVRSLLRRRPKPCSEACPVGRTVEAAGITRPLPRWPAWLCSLALTGAGRMSAPGHASTSVMESVGQVDRRMRLADRFLVRTGHERKSLPSFRLTCAAWPKRRASRRPPRAWRTARRTALPSAPASESALALVAWVSMKYFMSGSPGWTVVDRPAAACSRQTRRCQRRIRTFMLSSFLLYTRHTSHPGDGGPCGPVRRQRERDYPCWRGAADQSLLPSRLLSMSCAFPERKRLAQPRLAFPW